MGRKRRRRRRKSRLVPVVLISLIVIAAVVLSVKMFSSKGYLQQIKEVMSYNSIEAECTVSRVSKVDVRVYSQGGVKYTNRHTDIQPLGSYTDKTDMEKIITARTMLNNIESLKKGETVSELPEKKDGYYWIRLKLKTEEKGFMSKKNNNYSIDLFYDIAGRTLFIKDKYYDEFSGRNNKVKLTGYSVDDKYLKLIDELANVAGDATENNAEENE